MAQPVIPPPVYLSAGLLAQRLLSRSPKRAGLLRRAAAAGLSAASTALLMGTVSSFRTRDTTVHPLHPEKASALVTDGTNAISRNPMYLGMAGILAAQAIRRGGWATLLPLAAFVVVIDRTQIAAEEEALRERFGTAYADYAGRVPRWVDRRSVESLRELVESVRG